ncbi:hypothetical protein BDZ89DRAFT_1133693 [Hymenopellis radicata]|nr:hypothetical protein BDZ89DRAFT_1133693 [Hymenopellis radicata]
MSRNIDLPHSSAAVLSSCRIFSFHDGFNENVDGLPPEEVFDSGLDLEVFSERVVFGVLTGVSKARATVETVPQFVQNRV